MFQSYFTQPQQMFETWQQALKEQLARVESLSEQFGKLQQQGLERFSEAIDQSAALSKAAVGYAAQLGTDWRKLWMDSTKQAASVKTPGA